ncbi:LysR family transcriptional regulator [Iodobacter ciconiae]|uniref:LysR family transcriptional regulator n=1 Tax=Iodobacter ciconiae TaxID=2496266 RepID=A0A3S8ZPW4_9NEIS|nr:LysR family transcriptional regulator [Iodobacter ciconiae]AZN35505.1 LysR family transcriptional regulator [Iodobacter ciconiae]
MHPTEAMQIFIRVAELGSFTLAAQALAQPRATVSSAVQQLESWLGVQLLLRTTRKVQITPDGQAFYERSRDLLADMDELQNLFQHTSATLKGRLRVDMPAGIATQMVLPRLPEFMAEHPQLQIELSSTDRRVDLVRDGFDCVIRVGQLADSNYIARPLGQMRQINCASPAYLAAHGTPLQLADLAQHQLIHYQPNLGDKVLGWEYHDGQSVQQIQMGGLLTVNHTDSYQAACVAGLGLIQVPELGVQHLLASGQLCEILPQYCAPSLPISLLYTQRRHLSKRVQVFMQWISTISAHYLTSTSSI